MNLLIELCGQGLTKSLSVSQFSDPFLDSVLATAKGQFMFQFLNWLE